MSTRLLISALVSVVPLLLIIAYNDVRYRRIPNPYVLAILVCGFGLNWTFGGVNGVVSSIGGLVLAFGLMFLMHLVGAMGAGDVKLLAPLAQ